MPNLVADQQHHQEQGARANRAREQLERPGDPVADEQGDLLALQQHQPPDRIDGKSGCRDRAIRGSAATASVTNIRAPIAASTGRGSKKRPTITAQTTIGTVASAQTPSRTQGGWQARGQQREPDHHGDDHRAEHR